MPRPDSYAPEDLQDRALSQFWAHGFEGTSMDDLVRTTGVSRHGIYKTFGGKRALFLACFDRYQDTVVTPAFARVEGDGSSLEDVRRYFHHQIDLAETSGLPGPGCFVGNSATETAPHDTAVLACVAQHNARLKVGFANALKINGFSAERASVLAEIMVAFSTGLWALSRVTDRAESLRQSVDSFLHVIKRSER